MPANNHTACSNLVGDESDLVAQVCFGSSTRRNHETHSFRGDGVDSGMLEHSVVLVFLAHHAARHVPRKYTSMRIAHYGKNLSYKAIMVFGVLPERRNPIGNPKIELEVLVLFVQRKNCTNDTHQYMYGRHAYTPGVACAHAHARCMGGTGQGMRGHLSARVSIDTIRPFKIKQFARFRSGFVSECRIFGSWPIVQIFATDRPIFCWGRCRSSILALTANFVLGAEGRLSCDRRMFSPSKKNTKRTANIHI